MGERVKKRLEKLNLLTLADKTDPNYAKAKKARKEDLLHCQIRVLAEKADAAHNRRWYALWFWGKNSDEWYRLKMVLDDLGRKVRAGERLEQKDWKALQGATEEYNRKAKKGEKKQAVVDAVLKTCDLALGTEELTQRQDEALIDLYNRERRGEFAAASFVRDNSYWYDHHGWRHCYRDCFGLYSSALAALDKADDYILGLPGDKGKAAYEEALNNLAAAGKARRGAEWHRASRLGAVAEVAANLAPVKDESPALTHAKSMFFHMRILSGDIESAKSEYSNSKQYKAFRNAARRYTGYVLDIITGRNGEVKTDDYYEAFNQLQECAEAYLTMKLELGEMSNDEKKAFIENLKKFGPSDYIDKQYEGYKKDKKSTEYETYKKCKDVLRNDRTKKKVNLALDVLRLKPFEKTLTANHKEAQL